MIAHVRCCRPTRGVVVGRLTSQRSFESRPHLARKMMQVDLIRDRAEHAASSERMGPSDAPVPVGLDLGHDEAVRRELDPKRFPLLGRLIRTAALGDLASCIVRLLLPFLRSSLLLSRVSTAP